jgi:RNA polymerase sigma-70 factor (ECF subfamily)
VNVRVATLSLGLPEAKRGDLAAFEQLIRTHERTVFRLAWRLVGNPDDAAEIAQEVFLKLYRNMGSVDEGRNVGAWLYRVTVNASNDVLRKRRPTAALDEFTHVSAAPSPEQSLAADQRRELALRALDMLPPKERAAVVLRDVEGLSTAEVAEALGSSEVTVRSQISTARVKLKRIVDAMLARRQS